MLVLSALIDLSVNVKMRLPARTLGPGEKLKEPRDDPKESTGEKEGSGAAELNNRSQHGAIVPALGPRPDRVRRSLFSAYWLLLNRNPTVI